MQLSPRNRLRKRARIHTLCRINKTLTLLGNALTRPREVASVAPSSRFVTRAVCAHVASTMRQVVVEFGPGTGPITRELLKKDVLTPDSKLIVIEMNKKLAAYLQKTVHDPRVTIVEDTAQHVRDVLKNCGEEFADVVISGIPYSYLSEQERDEIIAETAAMLRPGGRHIVYQVRDTVEPSLYKHFSEVTHTRIWRNIPPLHLFDARHPKVPNV